jgi:DNA-binding protein Fis
MATSRPHSTLQATDAVDPDIRRQKLEEIWGHFPTLEEAENLLTDLALTAAQGNQGTAAAMLGLKRQTLNIRLKNRKAPL